MNKEKIKERLEEHYKEASKYYKNEIIGLFLTGSQNYGLDTENSDVDTRLIILPTFEEFVYNMPAMNKILELENGEQIKVQDFRVFTKELRKQYFNTIEVLYTDFKILNPFYENLWNNLVVNRELLSHYNPYGVVASTIGVAKSKYKKLEEPRNKVKALFEGIEYDAKRLSDLLWLEHYLTHYLGGSPYIEAIKPFNNQLMLDAKNGKFTLEEARSLGKNAYDEIIRIGERYIKAVELVENKTNDEAERILNQVQHDIIQKSMLHYLIWRD